MRKLFYVIVGFLVFYGLAAWTLGLPPLGGAPGFYRNVDPRGQVYLCTDGRNSRFFVRFEDEGRAAVILVDGQTVRLTFAGYVFPEEVYLGGPWRLHLDPEANLYGPNNLHYGNCG